MDFKEIMRTRRSCRTFDPNRQISEEDLKAIVEAGRLSPSATNAQPYTFHIARGEAASFIAEARVMKTNRFIQNATAFILVCEDKATALAKIGSRITKSDFTSIDIGIAVANMDNMATELGIGSCILGIFDQGAIKKRFHLERDVRLILALGYDRKDEVKEKRRKSFETIVSYLE